MNINLEDFNLSEAEMDAVLIIKAWLDCYNIGEGTGLFSGIERYAMLEGRIKIAAVQSQTVMNFWSNLRNKLLVPLAPKKDDAKIAKFWKGLPSHQMNILNIFARQAGEIIMIARMLCEQDKPKKLAKK